MKVRRLEFIWKKVSKESFNFGNIEEIKISIFENTKKMIVEVVSGDLKIVDGTIRIDSDNVLRLIGKIDFDNGRIGRSFDFFKYSWQMTINDSVYSGVFQYPKFVADVRKIIRFDAIFCAMNKKIASYSKNNVNIMPFFE